MKVAIPGGSGAGRHDSGSGVSQQHVVVLSRRPRIRPWRVVAWDGSTLGEWQREIDGCDVVINLSGIASTAGTLPRIEKRSCDRASRRRESWGTRLREHRVRRACGYDREHRDDLCSF